MRSLLALGLFASFLSGCATDDRIFTAVGSHDHDLTLELVEAGADVGARDVRGITPLILAVFSENLEGVRILLEHDADPNTRRKGGAPTGSALFWAKDRPTIDLLVSYGADLDLRDSEGRTALLWNAAWGNSTTVRDLIAAGADVSIRDYHGSGVTDAAAANLSRLPRSDLDALVEVLRQAGAL